MATVRHDHLHTVEFGDDLQYNRAANQGSWTAVKDQKALDGHKGTPHRDGRQTCSRNSASFPPRSWLRLNQPWLEKPTPAQAFLFRLAQSISSDISISTSTSKSTDPLPQPKWEVPSALGTEHVEQAALGTEYLAISTSPGQEVSHYDPPPKPSHSSSETKAGSGYSVPPTPVPTPAHTASQLCLEIQLRPCPRFPFLIPSIFSPLVLQLRRPSSIASSPSISLRRPFYPIWSTLARRAF